MVEQEHTDGRDGDSPESAGAQDANQGEGRQAGRRHSWGSKSGNTGTPPASNLDADDKRRPARDDARNERAPEVQRAPFEQHERPAPDRNDRDARERSDDRRGPRAGSGSRGASGGQDRDRSSNQQGYQRGERDSGQDRSRDRGGRPPQRSANASPRDPDSGRGAQRRGAASRGGSGSGSAGDRQARSGARSGAPTGRGADGPARDDRRGNDRRSDSRFGGGEQAGPRPHNARDLRSANRPDRERSPEIDEDVKGDELDRVTRAQIRHLEERSALWVSKHLVMAGRLIDLDPELAFQHALAASRRGGRLAAVREAVGLTAYAAGHYGEALREFRTFRRISGSNVHLPVMADCERGLGRPDRALDLARSEEAESLDAAGKAELAMVVSGARADMGQLDAAVAALEIPQLDIHRAFSFSPRMFRAYADALEAVGQAEESARWRRQAGVADKALGLEDDLEPDIIDLGDDDDDQRPAPAAVPKVADLLGSTAGRTVTETGLDEEVPDEEVPDEDVPAEASEQDDIVPDVAFELEGVEASKLQGGESTEPLQTEMLFTMDDAGDAATAEGPNDRTDAEPKRSAGTDADGKDADD